MTYLGPMRLPVLGSVIHLYRANPNYPHLAMAKLSQKYGDIMSVGFGMHTAGNNKPERWFTNDFAFLFLIFTFHLNLVKFE